MKITEKEGTLILHVKVVPNSSRTQIVGTLGDALKIKVAQPPEGGKANAGVIAALAEALHIAPAQVTITAGHTRALKTVQIAGVTPADARQRLGIN